MSYKLKYTVPFKTINNSSMLVEILLEGYTGEAMELVGAESPFNVSTDDEDFLYTPYRFSSATLSLVGGDYMQELYSTGYQQYKVNLKREGIIIWTGFISPEMYTQDYANQTFEIDIECVSAMSVLEYIDYKKVSNKITFVTIQSLIQKCVEESKGDYTSIYIPRVYSTEANMASDALRLMEISEQNFFDEDDKAMNLKEILEEVCKFLNWTCVDWSGDLYFVDIDHQGEYFQCAKDFLSGSNVNAINSLTVQNLGFAGSGHTFDILGGYNKVTVKDSNYCINQIFPEEDFDKLEAFEQKREYNFKNRVEVKQVFYPDAYKLYRYKDKEFDMKLLTDAEVDAYKNSSRFYMGASATKRCMYTMAEKDGSWIPSITNYDWENIILVRTLLNYGNLKCDRLDYNKPILSIDGPCISIIDGAFSLNVDLELLFGDELSYLDGMKSKWAEMRCRLSIGDNYYNGIAWEKSTIEPVGTNNSFIISFDGNKLSSGFARNNDTKKLNMPYTGMSGYIIPIACKDIMRGNIKFTMLGVRTSEDEVLFMPGGYAIKDLKLEYKKIDGADLNSKSSDRTYQNVITEKYINPLDDIEFKISSYNDDGLCHSKVMLGNQYLTNNLYSAIYSRKIRPEEQLIQRIVNQYNKPKKKLTQELKYNQSVTPITELSDVFMIGNRFALVGEKIDFKNERTTCTMIEKW